MNFADLQNNLRKVLWWRIDNQSLTGMKLAQQIGVEQGHVSNFLNRKRGLSVAAMDRALGAQRLSVLDLLKPAEINKRATLVPPSEEDYESVVLVRATVAAREPLVEQQQVQDALKFKKTFLRRLRPASGRERRKWQRFVLVKVEARDGMSMYPRLTPGATVLVDRHYNSLQPYRRGSDRNMYAVRTPSGCTVKYVEMSGGNMVLRPHNQEYPVEVVDLPAGAAPEDMIVGRVCHVAIEV